MGESNSDTVVREAWEATDTEAKVVDISGILTNPRYLMLHDDGQAHQQFRICFRARPIDGEIRTSDETTQVRWISPSDLRKFDIPRGPKSVHSFWKCEMPDSYPFTAIISNFLAAFPIPSTFPNRRPCHPSRGN
ncbi:NUDIX domain-containing protein [Streptomyces rubiginosohelvolus]|uniref:NUDIX domain-containing protein n=1 Tax=Streptomyces rubiginosohelvolus TaxID=67362 RepID=UPI00380DF58E